MRSNTFLRSISSQRMRIACVVLLLMATALGRAQTAEVEGFQFESGLFTFFTGDGRFLRVTVTELGSATAESRVTIVLRGPDERVVARTEGPLVLRRGQPASLDVPLTISTPTAQLRASVTVFGRPDRGSVPMVVMEHIDPGSFTIGSNFSCSASLPSVGPFIPSCVGGGVSHFVR